MKRLTIPDIAASATPLVVLTAYTAPMARLLDLHVDILLVGDSLGMVLYGMENTRGVTLEMMRAHGRAVVNASERALVVVDMPYGSYASPEMAYDNAAKLLQDTGAQAVKLEGGVEMAETIRTLVAKDIAVMGHVGLLPQSVESPSGYRFQGRTQQEAENIMQGALAVEAAGAFAVVIEAVKEEVARAVSDRLRIPSIGIGASVACNGQVLVTEDMLGLSAGYIPGFVKPYASLAGQVEEAVKLYAKEVRGREFPSAEFCYPYKKE